MSIIDEAQRLKDMLEKELSIKVSVAIFGQPGAGKSSIVNKLVGKKVAEVGVETDKTIDAVYYEVDGIYLVDLPGYGTKNYPKETYFTKFEINKFDLFLCVSSGKLHQADTEFFQELKKIGKVCIFVVNKHDDLWEEGISIEELEKRKIEDISKHVGQPVKVIFTSCKKNTGLSELNDEIKNNLDNAKKERWLRGAKAYSSDFLSSKKQSCEKYVAIAAAASAANGINPIPGVDVAVDVKILMKLFASIREDFGLSEDFLDKLKESTIPIVARLANNVVKYAVKEGIMLLLKQFAGKQVAKTFAKYIPFIGQAIAAGIGFAVTSNVGKSYLNDCSELAEEVLKNNLENK